MADVKLKLNYQSQPDGEVFESLNEAIQQEYGIDLKFSPSEESTDVVPDVRETLGYFNRLTDQDGHAEALLAIKRQFKTKKSLRESLAFRRDIKLSTLTEDSFPLPTLVEQALETVDALVDDSFKLTTDARTRLRTFRYTTPDELDVALTRLVDLPIPYTDKRIKILPKSMKEITINLKEFLKMVSLFGTLVILLEKRVTDWVLLQGLMYLVWAYVFWILANEFFHIKIIDATEDDLEAIAEFKSSFLKLNPKGNLS